MEDCGRGAAVEQLTARGMEEYQSPRWGAIANLKEASLERADINPRYGGQ